MQWLKAFIAGFVATLVFHQGVFALLYMAEVVPVAPFNMTPVAPLGIPQVVSLAFFGGLWGIPAWALIRHRGRAMYWSIATLFGAIAPTVVAMLVVFPMKGREVEAATWVGGLILNGAWGIGVAVVMILLGGKGKTINDF